MNTPCRPIATYRLQFNRDFRLADAQALVPYFSRLGITHLYASPILRSQRESTHGYDVVDPRTISPTVGDEADLVNLNVDLRNFGLGLLLDIVPNHMAADIENPYWRDVLTYGSSSPFANWFDIDWRMPDPEMRGRVLVPVLGEPRARILEQDQIRIVWAEGRFMVRYFDHTFPIDPATIPLIGQFALNTVISPRQTYDGEPPALEGIQRILGRLADLPGVRARLRRRTRIDRDNTEGLLAEFAQLVTQSPRIQQWIEQAAEQFSRGEAGRKRLRRLLDCQPYRLVYWRAASRTINYRRFFDINELISLRQEDPEVFYETHATVLRWIDEGLIDGLRIDHIDGLRDPHGYLIRMSEALSKGERASKQIPIFVEKILAADERLPRTWPVAGTTGYEFLNEVEALFVSASGFTKLEDNYRRIIRRPADFKHTKTWGKRRVLRSDLSPQVRRLADGLLRMATEQTPPRDAAMGTHESTSLAQATDTQERTDGQIACGAVALLRSPRLTKRECIDAIVEVITALPVYRTYVDSHNLTVGDVDRHYIETALRTAYQRGQATPEAIAFLGDILLLQGTDRLPDHALHERVKFIERFQQLTGPAAAKGIEDTALYAYVPLVSLNEVGGEPHLPSDSRANLDEANEHRATAWPQTMLAATTHDTKRTADVRARLDVLSELPTRWISLIRRWRRMHRRHIVQVRGKRAPASVAEYLLYQTIVGIWPAPPQHRRDELPPASVRSELTDRVALYMVKAIREAKTDTSWTATDQAYEDAVNSFVRNVLSSSSPSGSAFLVDVQHLVARIARPGFWNSLARVLLQFTSPGTPDLYQGDELWNFALVDPDNRQPVDFAARQRLLDDVITGIEADEATRRDYVRGLIEAPEDGRIKLHVIHRALSARRDRPRLFASGRYVRLTVEGAAQGQLIAFARVTDTSLDSPATNPTVDDPEDCAIVVAPRLTVGLTEDSAKAPVGDAVWEDTVIRLPEHWKHREFTCILADETIRPTADGSVFVRDVLRTFPTALLLSRQRTPDT